MMAACSVPMSPPFQQIGAAGACAEKHGARGTCEARLAGSSGFVLSRGAVSSKRLGLGSWRCPEAERRQVGVRVQAGEGSLTQSEKWGEGVSLGTALLPPDVNLARLESLLFQVLPHLKFLL